MIVYLIQVMNSLSLAALLFIVASGFTLIFGLQRVVNLTHGALYLLGGYLGLTVIAAGANFAVGLGAAAIAIALVGFAIYRGLLRFVGDHELNQVLLTLGLAFVLNDLALVLWGADTLSVPVPEFLRGPVQLGPLFYPRYRLFVLAAGVVLFAVLWLVYTRTRLGAVIRAGVDDVEMAQAIGINIRRVFTWAFMGGCALAGVAGVLGGAFLTLYPTADVEILVFSLAVVIIGGRGSLVGAAIGSLLVAFLSTFGQVWFPELAYFVIFAPMAVLLAFRPLGLFGRA